VRSGGIRAPFGGRTRCDRQPNACQSAAALVTNAIRRGTTQNTPPIKNQLHQRHSLQF
jgi:hypothetical protein